MLHEVQQEVRNVLQEKDRPVDYEDIVAMKKLRSALLEGLRLYPEPPALISVEHVLTMNYHWAVPT